MRVGGCALLQPLGVRLGKFLGGYREHDAGNAGENGLWRLIEPLKQQRQPPQYVVQPHHREIVDWEKLGHVFGTKLGAAYAKDLELTAPAKFVHDEPGRRGTAISSLVSGGCIVSGTELRSSLLFTGVRANSYARIEEAVILPYVEVGRHARLKKVVIDRGVVIPDGLVVGDDPERDAARFRRTDSGVCLITQPMIDRLPD